MVDYHDEQGAEHMRDFDDQMQHLAKMHFRTDEIIEESLRQRRLEEIEQERKRSETDREMDREDSYEQRAPVRVDRKQR